MPEPTQDPDADAALVRELAALREEIAELNGHRFLRAHRSLWRLIGFQFVRGLALGLGTVVGATALVSIIAYFLRQIDFVPVIGDWAAEIAREMREGAE